MGGRVGVPRRLRGSRGRAAGPSRARQGASLEAWPEVWGPPRPPLLQAGGGLPTTPAPLDALPTTCLRNKLSAPDGLLGGTDDGKDTNRAGKRLPRGPLLDCPSFGLYSHQTHVLRWRKLPPEGPGMRPALMWERRGAYMSCILASNPTRA